ncbi:MAG: zf-HC2 domain-containing protein [Thermoanaerobaculales bacterium]|jgi:predicted anti-sigma-YlaC factor YlaD|nr:zf-HC2 domain-containing protein [Thermoanaerobaculales bacterium]
MTTTCPNGFDQTQLSGFLDGELTQAADQRVRLHLEDCAACRAVSDELLRLREATMTTRLDHPRDLEWDERPRGLLSGLSRGLGWLVLAFWAAATTGFALWQLATSPEDLTAKLIVFGGLLGVGLVFVSVLVDRLRSARTDRYREVQK